MTDGAVPATVRSPAYVNYVLCLIFLVAAFNVCDRTIVSVLVDDIKRDLALDDRQMGLVMGFAFSLTYLLAAWWMRSSIRSPHSTTMSMSRLPA